MVAAVLEQKVWADTGGVIYPNLYTFLVGNPGLGKSRAIIAASSIIRDALPEIHFGSTSMTRASLSDHMNEAKRFIHNIPYAPIEYNSLVAVADEFSAMMPEYDTHLVASLVEFYDVNPYSEGRRVANIRIKIAKPQLNILSGSTPSNLIHTLKEYVWEQGLMSRVIMVYADDRPIIDVFNEPKRDKPNHLIHDIKIINALMGEFKATEAFGRAMHNWKLLKMQPEPGHPKLRHYNTRRWAHALKLSMVANVDRCGDLLLDVQDFNRAMTWLLDAESRMPLIFQVGSVAPDARVMDEVCFFIKQHKGAVAEHLIVRFISERVPAYTINNVMNALQNSRMIKSIDVDPKTGLRKFIVT